MTTELNGDLVTVHGGHTGALGHHTIEHRFAPSTGGVRDGR
jgi:hypothetical protein